MNIEVLLGTDSAPALFNKPWIADGVDELEASVIQTLRELAALSEADGELLVRLPFLHTQGPVYAGTVEILSRMATDRPDLFRAVVDKPWVTDGLNEDENSVVQELQTLAHSSEEQALLLLSLPFLTTVEDTDIPTIDVLAALAPVHPQLFLAALHKPWLESGLSDERLASLWTLQQLENESAGLQILESVDVGDSALVAALTSLAEHESELFSAVVDRPWLDDGLDEAETILLKKLEAIASRYSAADLWIATTAACTEPDSLGEDCLGERFDVNNNDSIEHNEVISAVIDYSGDVITEYQLVHIVASYAFSESLIPTPELMDLVISSSWYKDGITIDSYYTEPGALRALQDIADNSPRLAKTLLRWPWIFDEQLNTSETVVIEYLNEIYKMDPELSQLIANLPWVTDDIGRWESSAISRFYELVHWNEPDFAAELVKAPWVADGVTSLEANYAITSLTHIAISPDYDTADPQMARRLLGMVRYPSNALDPPLIFAMRALREHIATNLQTGMDERTPDRLTRLLSEPWFTDGLDQEELVYLIAAGTTEPDLLYAPYTIESRAIELPLAGLVKLWVVSHKQFDPHNTLVNMERAVRGSEEFFEIPFPIEHVILYVFDSPIRGSFNHFMMWLYAYGGVIPPSSIIHETAHYYFNEGPSWFREGGANVVLAYISNNGNIPEPVFPANCADEGLQNIQDLIDVAGAKLWDRCRYSMGMHFLLVLHGVMGKEAWLSALKEFYLEYVLGEASRPTSSAGNLTDEEIYRVFLSHTPPELVEDVKDVFRRLHGGPFIDKEA